VPAGYYSDDEYVSGEDEDEDTLLPTPKFPGIQPPPNSQHTIKQLSVKDTSKNYLTSARKWTRNTSARRVPGTDPMELRKEFTFANESRNFGCTGLSTGKESGKTNPANWPDSALDKNSSDDNTPFGVPPKVRMKRHRDAANWDWVENVLKIKSAELATSQQSQEVRMQRENFQYVTNV